MELTKFVTKTGLVLKQYSPEIFLVLSLTAGGYALYQGVKYGQKIERQGTLRNARAALIDLRENPGENEKQIRQDIIMETARELIIPAIPMLTGAIVSAACAAASYKILHGRYAATAAALTTVTQAYTEYRNRTGGITAAYPGAVLNEDGKGATLPDNSFTQDVNAQLETDMAAIGLEPKKLRNTGTGFGFLWDKYSAHYHSGDQAANAFHIQAVERSLNQLLVGRGHVLLNELHDAFDVPRTPEGAVVGWIRNRNHPDSSIVLFPVGNVPGNSSSEVIVESNVMGVVFSMI